MAALIDEHNAEEGALKWIALAVLHGIDRNAKKINLRRSSDGNVTVTAKYRESDLPSPPAAIGDKVFNAVRDITHIEGEKGKSQVAIGIRDSSIEIEMKLDQEGQAEEVVLNFPN